jgi:hypothetical protein
MAKLLKASGAISAMPSDMISYEGSTEYIHNTTKEAQ